MTKIIVTDLTRFSTDEHLCTAGIEPDTGRCIRPWPYLKRARCQELNLLPGAVLEGEFSERGDAEPPHVEDMLYQNLTFLGPCTSEEFRDVLEISCVPDLSRGFGVEFDTRQKHIPYDVLAKQSIVTVRVRPDDLEVVQHQYDPEKAKIHFSDASGHVFNFLSITDLGFHVHAMKIKDSMTGYSTLNDFIRKQDAVYLRVGLSRRYKTRDGRDGFWVQVNGVYTFPEYLPSVRLYK